MLDKEKLEELKTLIVLYDDEPAYKTLFTMCFPSLVRYAFTYIKSRELSEEIVSDVLFNIWQQRKELNKINDLRLYLYVSARNIALNYIKKENRYATFSLDDAPVWLKADDITPEQLAISSELYQKINTAVKRLPPRCQIIYKLVKEDGLKYREVAELLHLSIKTIETQMGIALKKLYEALR